MTGKSRMRRVNAILHQVIAGELARLKDPGLGFVTITGVDTAPDLRSARVYYSVLGDKAQAEATGAALGRAGPRIRSVVGRQVRIKFLPELRFEIDESIERGLRIDRLLQDLEIEEGDAAT